MSAIIDIEHSHYTNSGPRYRVFLGDEILLKSSRVPLCDAARALADRGVTGRIQMRRRGSTRIDIEGLIAVLSTRTVSESQSTAPRFTKWSPHWAAEDEQLTYADFKREG